jgi:hypothetical protein
LDGHQSEALQVFVDFNEVVAVRHTEGLAEALFRRRAVPI